jgi:hypothetical protein
MKSGSEWTLPNNKKFGTGATFKNGKKFGTGVVSIGEKLIRPEKKVFSRKSPKQPEKNPGK